MSNSEVSARAAEAAAKSDRITIRRSIFNLATEVSLRGSVPPLGCEIIKPAARADQPPPLRFRRAKAVRGDRFGAPGFLTGKRRPIRCRGLAARSAGV
jgi:hypothetical protein